MDIPYVSRRLAIFLLELFTLFLLSKANAVVKEYCQMETFKPECGPNEVVIMEYAKYGRMKLGKCATVNYGNMGCYSNMRNYVDTLCSGRQTCEIKIPDDRMFESKPCPKDVTPYLEAAYRCQKVHLGDKFRAMCRNHRKVTLKDRDGFISSLSVKLDRVGSNICPWIIEAPPGQRINLTLYDFGSQIDIGSGDTAPMPFCQRYGLISEEGLSSPTTICSSSRRLRSIYTSETNKVKIQLLHDRHKEDQTNFILHYKVVGCKDPPLNGALLVRRTENTATLRCNRTGDQWQLRCKNGDWSGQRSNCTEHGGGWSVWKILTEEWSTPYGILITVGLGVTLGVIIGILLLICVLIFMKRKRALKRPDDQATYGTNEILEGDDIVNQKWDQADYRLTRGGLDRSSGPYAHVWDPETGDTERTDASSTPAHSDSNILARQYGIPRDLLTHNKPTHQYGIYDRRTDHVYEKPT